MTPRMSTSGHNHLHLSSRLGYGARRWIAVATLVVLALHLLVMAPCLQDDGCPVCQALRAADLTGGAIVAAGPLSLVPVAPPLPSIYHVVATSSGSPRAPPVSLTNAV